MKKIPSQYWTNLKENIEKANELLLSTCRNGETLFTSMAVVCDNIFSNHKDSKDLVSVIIPLGGNISGRDTVFYDVVKTSDLGNIAHALQHLHGRMVFGPFEKKT